MKNSVVEFIATYALERPDFPAVIVKNEIITYKTLWNYIKGFSLFLQKEGKVKKGDRVVVKATQSLAYVISYFATHLSGGIFVPVERNIAVSGLKNIVMSTDAQVVILAPTDEEFDSSKLVLKSSIVEKLAIEYLVSADSIVFPLSTDSADILFTTGTTGTSKGVELSHRALVATAENLIWGLEMKKDTRILVPGPLNHANPIRKLFTSMVNGSTIVILNGLTNIKAFFDALDSSLGTTACCLPPSAIRTIFQITGDKLKEYGDKIDFIESATAPLPEPDKLRLCQMLPRTRLYNNYGSSEAASVCMYDYNRYPGKQNCVGKAMPNSKIIIVDDEKREKKSSISSPGLLACIGDVCMKGYWQDPELTSQVLKGNIVYTSDIGYIDSENFIYVIGRKGDVINVGGLKVAPTEVEAVALGLELIDDCICVPIDDTISGKAIKLCVVVKKGKTFDPLVIKKYLREHLENYKVPKYIEVIDKVPRTYNGKIDRKQLGDCKL